MKFAVILSFVNPAMDEREARDVFLVEATQEEANELESTLRKLINEHDGNDTWFELDMEEVEEATGLEVAKNLQIMLADEFEED